MTEIDQTLTKPKGIQDLYKKYYRWMTSFFVTTSLLLIVVSFLIPSEGVYVYVGTALRNVGISIFIASTVSAYFSEYYRSVREEILQKEFAAYIARVEQILETQKEIIKDPIRRNLENAGIIALFPNRKGAATEDLRSKLESIEEGTIRLLGATLRVFFHPGSDFTATVHKIIRNKPKVKFEVLLLNLNSLQALYRSEAETDTPFIDDEDYKKRSVQFKEGEMSRMQIDILNHLVKGYRPIEVRFYDTAPNCFLAMFDDVCYATQYLYGEPSTQVTTIELPLIKYGAGSLPFKRFRWNFDYVWKHAIPYEEVLRSFEKRPVVQTYHLRKKSTT